MFRQLKSYCYCSAKTVYYKQRTEKKRSCVEYISVSKAAEQWDISDRRVRILCQQGKIDGVIRQGRAWMIPADAEKPIDGRTTRYQWNDSPYAELFAETDALKAELDKRRRLRMQQKTAPC